MAKSYKDNVLEALTQKAKGKDFSLSQNRPGFLSGMESAMKEPGDLEQWPVDKLREHPDNSRYFQPLTGADFERLKEDIEKNGMHDALIVTAEDKDGVRTVLSGHNRLNAARALKMDTIPVRVKKFTNPEAAVRFMIRDNLLRRQLTPGEKAAFIAKLYPEAMDKDDKGGRPENPDTVSGLLPQTLADVSRETGLSDRQLRRIKQTHKTAKDLAKGKPPTLAHYEQATKEQAEKRRTTENRGKTGVQTSQEAPQRTQKGGVGERVGGKKDAGAELLIMTADFLKAARALRGLKKADVDRAVDKIKTLYNICE